jgi:hypothetical protein
MRQNRPKLVAHRALALFSLPPRRVLLEGWWRARADLKDPLLVTPFEGLFYLRQHFTAGIGLCEKGNVE